MALSCQLSCSKKRIPILSILDTGGACHDALYGSDNAENMRTHDLQNFALYLLCMETISYSFAHYKTSSVKFNGTYVLNLNLKARCKTPKVQIPTKSVLQQHEHDSTIYLYCKTNTPTKKSVASIKFIYSEKATKFWEISTLLLSYVRPVKSKVDISQNFVAFSVSMNFNGYNS